MLHLFGRRVVFKAIKFLATPNLTWPLLRVTAVQCGWRWTIPKSQLHPQICHHPHLKDERQMQEERQTEGETDRNKWFVTGMTMMTEGRGHGITESASSSPEPVAAPPVTLGRRPQPDTSGEKVSQRPWGPTTRQSSPQSLYTHTHTLTISVLIPHAPLTSLLKHRSKSPDWSQQLRNKWCQIPDSCMAFSAGKQAFHLCKYISILEMVCNSAQFRGS